MVELVADLRSRALDRDQLRHGLAGRPRSLNDAVRHGHGIRGVVPQRDRDDVRLRFRRPSHRPSEPGSGTPRSRCGSTAGPRPVEAVHEAGCMSVEDRSFPYHVAAGSRSVGVQRQRGAVRDPLRGRALLG